MTVWVIITTSLIIPKYKERKVQYIAGITSILEKIKNRNYKVVIVENNSKLNKRYGLLHTTFLDDFNVPVLYTKNNILLKYTNNYGIMEITDVFECIRYFGIQDDDFIIKFTGRYVVSDECDFFDRVDNLDKTNYSAILRFSQYDEPVSLVKTHNCTTGLIGLKCKYVKQIEVPDLKDEKTAIEMNWAKVISKLDESEICFLSKLGLFIKPLAVSEDVGYYYL